MFWIILARSEQIWKRLRTEIDRAYDKIEAGVPGRDFVGEVTIEDFAAYMPSHSYIYIPTFDFGLGNFNWRIPPIVVGRMTGRTHKNFGERMARSNNPVEQTTSVRGSHVDPRPNLCRTADGSKRLE